MEIGNHGSFCLLVSNSFQFFPLLPEMHRHYEPLRAAETGKKDVTCDVHVERSERKLRFENSELT